MWFCNFSIDWKAGNSFLGVLPKYCKLYDCIFDIVKPAKIGTFLYM